MSAPRVGYVSEVDPTDPWGWSGTHASMYQALRGSGLEVVHVGASLISRPWRGRRLAEVLGLASAPNAPAADSASEALRRGRLLSAEVKTLGCDVLFAPVASASVPFLETDLPLAYLSDATFRLLRNYYPDAASLPADIAARREELETLTIARASLLVYPSSWAASSAIADYGARPERVRVIDFGPNLDGLPEASEVLARPWGAPCRLLFLGRDWRRKGGDIALEAREGLGGLGIDATLTVCGSCPPGRRPLPGVHVEEPLDKRRPGDRARLRRLLMQAHFLILPTRADCYSMVACEASAFGLPVVVAATGGVPSAVRDGENGLLLPPESRGDAYARTIAQAFATEGGYRSLVRSSRAAHDTRLNWRTWGAQMRHELHALAGGASR